MSLVFHNNVTAEDFLDALLEHEFGCEDFYMFYYNVMMTLGIDPDVDDYGWTFKYFRTKINNFNDALENNGGDAIEIPESVNHNTYKGVLLSRGRLVNEV